MQIRFIPRGVKEVQAFLWSIPRGMKKSVLGAMTKYFIGNQSHGLAHYSQYKYVTRKKAYGQTFVSDKQRRYVMARIREGSIDPGVPHRTGRGQRGWEMIETTRGYTIKNPEKSMYFSMSDKGQANLNRLAGWKTVSEKVASNMAGAMRAGLAALRELIARKGK